MTLRLPTDLATPGYLVAVGVSGGPDSMALCHYLATHPSHPKVLALSVDHGLRAESEKEVQQVSNWLSTWPQVTHHTLTWRPVPKPQSRILESARTARYELLTDFCHHHHINELYLGHHLDDQVETFLFRLSKGSGLDGLGAMYRRQEIDLYLSLYRPFLTITKQQLIDYCHHHALPYFTDPTNADQKYARPRLRQSMRILENEGLTPKRLSKTTERLRRARDALEIITDQYLKQVIEPTSKGVTYRITKAVDIPEEIRVRLLRRAIYSCQKSTGYSPRLEKIEDLYQQIIHQRPFRKQTLAGVIFEITHNNGEEILHLYPEKC